MTDEQAREIGMLVCEGYTSGRIDDDRSSMVCTLTTEEWDDED